MKENFEVSKQILLQTLNVKLSYESIIQKALADKEVRGKMRKIIQKKYHQDNLNIKPKQHEMKISSF